WRDHPPTGTLLDLSKPQPPRPAAINPREETGAAAAPSQPLTAFTAPSNLIPRSLFAILGLPSCSDCTAGSNNWVVAGDHTASGKPLLSNDMHLDLTVPNIWYVAGLRAPGIHVAGVTLPGIPWVIAGHNEHIAWGFTALGGDVQDLYMEKLDERGNYYEAPTPTSSGAWKPLSHDRESISVRGGRDVTLDIRVTDHGPLLSSLLPKSAPPIALKWTLFDSTLNSIPLFEIDTA